MSALRKFFLGTWPGRVLMIPFRMLGPLFVFTKPVLRSIIWLFSSREHHNYTYNLEELNQRYLISFVSVITGQSYETIAGYLRELETDEQLRNHILLHTVTTQEKYAADPVVRYGRRLGWYALVRALKPALAIETGVDKGLGSCVIAAALMKNAEEGAPGKVLALDINPAAGYLIRPPYNKFAEFVLGDSLETLRKLQAKIDFFIHDSDHALQHEENELALIKNKLSDRALVLSDNSLVSDKLLVFAHETGREFLFFTDRPKNHWIQGDGIGVAFPKIRS